MGDMTFSTWLTWLLMAALAGSGALALIGGKILRNTYARWSYPESYRYSSVRTVGLKFNGEICPPRTDDAISP